MNSGLLGVRSARDLLQETPERYREEGSEVGRESLSGCMSKTSIEFWFSALLSNSWCNLEVSFSHTGSWMVSLTHVLIFHSFPISQSGLGKDSEAK